MPRISDWKFRITDIRATAVPALNTPGLDSAPLR
jgi:hypothetical protein